MNKKINIPKKGASRKWAQRLKELGQRRPPKDLVDKINRDAENKKSAMPVEPQRDLDV